MKFDLLQLIQKVTRLIETVSPRLAAWWASRLFFSPRSSPRKAPHIAAMKQHWQPYTRSYKNAGQTSRVKVYTAGDGPNILLVHGWEDAASSHKLLAETIIAQGFRVILFDLPAHGLSPDKNTSLPEVSDLIQLIAQQQGGIKVVIGHSFGASSAGYAINAGLSCDAFISISAPSSIAFMIDRFCQMIGASKQTKLSLIKEIDAMVQHPHEQASLIELAPFKQQKGLILHDRRDRMVPYQLAQAFAKNWPEAQFITTKGLGHSRILQSQQLSKAIIDFLSQ